MAVAGPFSGSTQRDDVLRLRPAQRWPFLRYPAHVGRGIALWGLGAHALAYLGGLVFMAVGLVREVAAIGGLPDMRGVPLFLGLIGWLSAIPALIAAGAGLIYGLMTLPLAKQRPGTGARITGVLVAMTSFAVAFEVFSDDGLTGVAVTPWPVVVVLVAGVAAWFAAPWLWPRHLHRTGSPGRALPPPDPRDRIARSFST